MQRVYGIFPRQDRGFEEFRGFVGMELGICRVAKSSKEGAECWLQRQPRNMTPSIRHVVTTKRVIIMDGVPRRANYIIYGVQRQV